MAMSDGTLTIFTNVDTSGVNSGISRITKLMSGLKSTMAGLFAVTGFVKLGAQAIQAASDLMEYKNVAVNTFKTLNGDLDKFINRVQSVDSAGKVIDKSLRGVIESYGMSELTATKVASGYMAMGNSIGMANKEASKMALTLTGLVGDMASFYNISQEQARTALAAVYTGETETLKQYGIMLQEVNLQQYENEHGLGRSVAKMSAAEKTLLRYNYVMTATSDAQGDFARTANQWANQVRVLKEQWTQLLVVIGGGLKRVFSPIIVYMNMAIAKVIDFANVVGQALGKIFHLDWTEYKYVADTTADVADSTQDVADSTNNAAKATKKATKAQTKYNRSLAKFDELNIIASKTEKAGTNPSSGTGGKSGAGTGGGSGAGTGSGHVEEIKHAYESDIKDLFSLGRKISDTLSEAMESINWQKIYKKAKDFGKGLAEFLNGLITPRLFYNVGKTIAGALNTALYFLNSFGETFDWANFGESIASGINGFFENFDFKTLGKTIHAWLKGIRTTIKEAIKNLNWSAIESALSDVFSEITIGDIATIIGLVTIAKVGKFVLGGGVMNALKTFLSGKIAAAWASACAEGGIITTMTTKLQALMAAVFSGVSLKAAATSLFGPVLTTIAGIASLVAGAIIAVKSFINIWTKGFSKMRVATYALGAALAVLGAALLFGPVGAAIAGIIAGIALLVLVIKRNWKAIKSFVTKFATTFIEGAKQVLTVFKDFGKKILKYILLPITAPMKLAKNLFTKLKDAFKGKTPKEIGKMILLGILKGLIAAITFIPKYTIKLFKAIVSGIKKRFGIASPAKKMFVIGKYILLGILQGLVNAIKLLGTGIKKVFTFVVKKFKDGLKNIKKVFKSLPKWFKTTIVDGIKNAFKNIGKGIAEKFKGVKEAILGKFTKVGEWFGDTVDGIKEAFGNVKDGIAEKFEGVKEKITSFFKGGKEDIEDEYKNLKFELQAKMKEIDESDLPEDQKELLKKKFLDRAVNIKASLEKKDGSNSLWTLLSNTGEKIQRTLSLILEKGKEFVSGAWEYLSNTKVGKTISVGVEKARAWAADAWEAAKTKAGSVTRKLTQSVLKGKWVSTAWEGVKKLGGTVSRTLRQAVTKGSWSSDAWTAVKTKAATVTRTLKQAVKKLGTYASDAMVAVRTTAGTVKRTIEVNIKRIGEAAKTGIQAFWKLITGKATGGIFRNGKWNKIQGYANGGSPASSQLFYARENGIPELVGRIGRNTAVMNNNQIVSSVAAGVYQAVAAAMHGLTNYFGNMTNALNHIPSAIANIEFTATPTIGIPVSVPHLAKGAVIPPNKEFMAVLGDQKNGQNIETPLSTMVEAFKTAIADMSLNNSNNNDIIIQIDGKEVFRAVQKQNNNYIKRTGSSAFSY